MEAFLIFGMWKNSDTVLNFSEVTSSGGSNIRSGQIFHVDEGLLRVGFMYLSPRGTSDMFELRGAVFETREGAVEVSRRGGGRLIFEEVLVS
jgi:hypothetical protein